MRCSSGWCLFERAEWPRVPCIAAEKVANQWAFDGGVLSTRRRGGFDIPSRRGVVPGVVDALGLGQRSAVGRHAPLRCVSNQTGEPSTLRRTRTMLRPRRLRWPLITVAEYNSVAVSGIRKRGQPSAGGRVAVPMAERGLSEATRGPPDRLAGGDNRYGRYPPGNIQTWNGGCPLCRRLPEHADESIDVRFVIVNVGADAHQAETGADEHLFGLHTPDHVVGHACGKPQ